MNQQEMIEKHKIRAQEICNTFQEIFETEVSDFQENTKMAYPTAVDVSYANLMSLITSLRNNMLTSFFASHEEQMAKRKDLQ